MQRRWETGTPKTHNTEIHLGKANTVKAGRSQKEKRVKKMANTMVTMVLGLGIGKEKKVVKTKMMILYQLQKPNKHLLPPTAHPATRPLKVSFWYQTDLILLSDMPVGVRYNNQAAGWPYKLQQIHIMEPRWANVLLLVRMMM